MKYQLLWTLLFLPLTIFAQETEEEQPENVTITILQRPLEFNGFMSESTRKNIAENPSADYTKLDFSSGRDWMVYSDRGNNAIYKSPGSAEVIEKVNLGAALRVTQISSNGWLQVMTKEDQVLGQTTGWIKGIYLILSNSPLPTKERIARKAIVISNVNSSKDIVLDDISSSAGVVYSRPNTIDSYRIKSKSAKTFQIFYVMKESPKAYLLSSAVAVNDMSSSIFGWIPKSNLTDWNSRVCYAPNYGEDARKTYPYPIPFTFKEEDLSSYTPAQPFSNGISTASCQFNVGFKELDYSMPRWPDIGTTRALGRNEREVLLITGSSMNPRDAEAIKKAREELEDKRKKISQVNLIFVLDATSSMRRYYKSIAESIEKLCQATKEWNGDEINLEVAVGFYRDYADGGKSFEVLSKQEYDPSVSDIINSQICYSVDPDRSEAVYQGIVKTLDLSGVSPDESNMVILIGDDGNHANDLKYTREQVLNKLNEYNAKLYIFQSTARMQAESMKFQEDALFWIDGIRSDSAFKLSYMADGLYGLIKDGNGISLTGNYGKIRTNFQGQGKATPPQKMETQLKTELNAWIAEVLDRISFLEDLVEGTSTEEVDCAELKKIFKSETAEALCKARSDISFSAHTVVRAPNTSADCLIPYVFLNRDEFNELKIHLRVLSNAGNARAQKEALNSLIYGLVNTITGGSASESALYDNKTLGELWETLFQVDLKMKQLRDVKLKDLQGIPTADFENVLQQLTKAADAFVNLTIEDYKWKTLRGQSFYWIPAEYFPGFENRR